MNLPSAALRLSKRIQLLLLDSPSHSPSMHTLLASCADLLKLAPRALSIILETSQPTSHLNPIHALHPLQRDAQESIHSVALQLLRNDALLSEAALCVSEALQALQNDPEARQAAHDLLQETRDLWDSTLKNLLDQHTSSHTPPIVPIGTLTFVLDHLLRTAIHALVPLHQPNPKERDDPPKNTHT